MKHKTNITLLLLLIFLSSHLIGLFVVKNYLPKEIGTGEISEKKLPLNIERPEIEEKTSFFTIFVFISTES